MNSDCEFHQLLSDAAFLFSMSPRPAAHTHTHIFMEGVCSASRPLVCGQRESQALWRSGRARYSQSEDRERERFPLWFSVFTVSGRSEVGFSCSDVSREVITHTQIQPLQLPTKSQHFHNFNNSRGFFSSLWGRCL